MDVGTAAIIAGVLGGPGLGVLVTKYVRPKVSVMDRLEALEIDFHILQDYTHELRQHIAEGKHPPPPPWPEGLRQ